MLLRLLILLLVLEIFKSGLFASVCVWRLLTRPLVKDLEAQPIIDAVLIEVSKRSLELLWDTPEALYTVAGGALLVFFAH